MKKILKSTVSKSQYLNKNITDTIEHLLNANQFLNEMRRITQRKIILVFPKQIPYLYTPDTHIFQKEIRMTVKLTGIKVLKKFIILFVHLQIHIQMLLQCKKEKNSI